MLFSLHLVSCNFASFKKQGEKYMDAGAIFTTFIIMFRETLEASLVIGIILTVLARMHQKKYFIHVFVSSFVAIGVSIMAGIGLMSLTESAKGGAEKLIEGGISLIACGILTYMVFWMNSQSKKIKGTIESKMEVAITHSEYMAIVSLPFFAIFREGAETVLFLTAMSARNSNAVSAVGGLAGFALAVFIAAAIFMGGKRVPVRKLFRVSGAFLLLIAAGLLAYGIHELQEIHLIPEIHAPVWNINHILNEKQGIGSFLKALFGYNGNPSLIEVVSYVLYLSTIVFFLKKSRPQPTVVKAHST